MAAKRRRFRSNYFGPKVKRPKTFELPKLGHRLLRFSTGSGKASVGDVMMCLLLEHWEELTEERITAVAKRFSDKGYQEGVLRRLREAAV